MEERHCESLPAAKSLTVFKEMDELRSIKLWQLHVPFIVIIIIIIIITYLKLKQLTIAHFVIFRLQNLKMGCLPIQYARSPLKLK